MAGLSSSLPLARPNRVGMERSRSHHRTSDATRVLGKITIIIDHRAPASRNDPPKARPRESYSENLISNAGE